jgi:hypothetical protein
MTRLGTLALAALIAGGSAFALAQAPAGDQRIASTDVADVCATDGLPGSAYSRNHRVVKRRPVPGHQVDHRVPLALGGADNDANVWAQPIDEALEKDRLERFAAIEVCRYRRVGLAEAQSWFLGDWRQQMWRVRR